MKVEGLKVIEKKLKGFNNFKLQGGPLAFLVEKLVHEGGG
jgi:hypothetical protein